MKKKSTLEKLTPLVLGTCMLTFVAACGSDDDDSGSGSSSGSQEQQTEGTYRVVLKPVNPTIAGTATGEGTFTIEGDEFRAVMNVSGAPEGEHDQHIHVGRRCPGTGDDANGDGIIDYVEASAATGGALIPLDSDLRSQEAGSDNTGGSSYSYNESASFLAMIADLRLPDTDNDDDLVKLGLDEDLNLAGKVVEIHGVPDSVNLPDTVRDSDEDDDDNDDANEDLPILCGVIERVADGGTTTGDTGTTTGDTGTTTGDTGTTTGDTGTTTGDTGTTTGDTGTTTGETGTTTGV